MPAICRHIIKTLALLRMFAAVIMPAGKSGLPIVAHNKKHSNPVY